MTYSLIVGMGTNDIAVQNHRHPPSGKYSRFVISASGPCKIKNLVIANRPIWNDMEFSGRFDKKTVNTHKIFIGCNVPFTFTVQSPVLNNAIIIQAFEY